MARNALERIVKAAESWKKQEPEFANHPYLNFQEEEWGHVTSFVRSSCVKKERGQNGNLAQSGKSKRGLTS